MNDIALRVEGGGNWRDNAAKITKHGRSFFSVPHQPADRAMGSF
jgi:hypothetical protein